VKFFEGVGRGPRTSRLDFGDHPGPEISKGFSVYYCDSRRQPKIKPGNPRRRLELCECFLDVDCLCILRYHPFIC